MTVTTPDPTADSGTRSADRPRRRRRWRWWALAAAAATGALIVVVVTTRSSTVEVKPAEVTAGWPYTIVDGTKVLIDDAGEFPALPVEAMPSHPALLDWVGFVPDPAGRMVLLQAATSSCEPATAVVLTETDSAVTVGLVHAAHDAAVPCTATSVSGTFRVDLAAPLGERRLLTAVSPQARGAARAADGTVG